MNEIEKFEKLQNRLKKIEPKLMELSGIRKTKRAQLKEIYKKWGVESLSELKELKEEKEKEVSAIIEKIQKYVDEMDEQLEKLDEAII